MSDEELKKHIEYQKIYQKKIVKSKNKSYKIVKTNKVFLTKMQSWPHQNQNRVKTLSKISMMYMCFCYFYEYFNDYPTPLLLRSLSLLIVFNLLIRVLALLLITSLLFKSSFDLFIPFLLVFLSFSTVVLSFLISSKSISVFSQLSLVF